MKIGKSNFRSGHLVCATLLVAALSGNGKDLFVAQNGLGDGSGSSANNALSLAWLNVPGNWGSGASRVSPGDTVHLCGSLTNTVNLLGSGSPGNVITVLFEPGATLTKPYWAPHPNSAFYGNGVHDVTIDGGINGVIQSTANGWSLAYTNPAGTPEGIWLSTLSNVSVKNLTISNLYLMFTDLWDGRNPGYAAQGIVVAGSCTNVAIRGNRIIQVGNAIVLNYYGYSSNVVVSENHCISNSWGIFANSTASGPGAYGFQFTSNVLDHFEAFQFTNSIGNYQNLYHNDPIILNANPAPNGTTNYGLVIACNRFGPSVGIGCSSDVYSYSSNPFAFEAPLIFNNLFLQATNTHISNGAIGLGMHNALIANNTFVSSNDGFLVGDIIQQTGSRWVNNMGYQVTQWITVSAGDSSLGPAQCDYNVIFCSLRPVTFNQPFNNFPFQWSWRQWTNALFGLDAHSTTNQPVLDARYAPGAGDLAAWRKGTNLSAYFDTDIEGNARPASGAWDIGAFQRQPPARPTNLRAK